MKYDKVIYIRNKLLFRGVAYDRCLVYVTEIMSCMEVVQYGRGIVGYSMVLVN